MLPYRAYSTLDIKSVSEGDRRVIVGIASTPVEDLGGDEMNPKGAEYQLPMPFLWFHQEERPIGNVTAVRNIKDGLEITAVIAPKGQLDWIDEAWILIKNGLVRGLSIGWKPLDAVRKANGGLKVNRWFWGETSAVTIPMNQEASITLVKSLDRAARASSGGAPVTHRNSPGFSGLVQKDAPMQLNVSDQITTTQKDIDTKSARFEELMAQELNEGSLGEQDAGERDTLSGELQTLKKRLQNLSVLQGTQMAQAATVQPRPAPARQETPRVEVKNLAPGTRFARYAMAVAAGKGSISDTLAYAKRWQGQTPEVIEYIKAVAGSTDTGSGVWGGELVFQNNLASEFVELIRPQTIIGRVQGFRSVPFNVRVPVQTGGSTVNWVGEQAAKPVTELSFSTLTVPNHKIAGIIVLTEELVRLSSPSAEETVRRDLTDQIAQFMDEQFIRVAVTAGANNPASITNGVSSPAASGTTLAALMADLKTALATFDTAGIPTEGLVIVTTPAVARTLSMMTTTLGTSPSGFNMTATGGTLLGYPVIVSASVDSGTIVIFKPSEIFLADDGRVTLDASNQATLDLAGGNTPDFNLWQKNCIGVRAERWITWVKRRAGAVAVIDTVAYVPGT
jgi:HK97 family phage major capsid protein